MPQQATLLCVSANADLRETRRRVLLTRYAVVAVSSVDALHEQPATTSFDVLVLCHTLSAKEISRAIRLARERWPGIRILSISALYTSSVVPGADAVLGGLAGPRAMLSVVANLLATPKAC
jgi:hypothetical protein